MRSTIAQSQFPLPRTPTSATSPVPVVVQRTPTTDASSLTSSSSAASPWTAGSGSGPATYSGLDLRNRAKSSVGARFQRKVAREGGAPLRKPQTQTANGAPPPCWLCTEKLAKVLLSGLYPLCDVCVKDVLLSVWTPTFEKVFEKVDFSVVKDIEEMVKVELELGKVGRSASGASGSGKMSPLCSPRQPSTSEWQCLRCTLDNSGFESICSACGARRPEAICPKCEEDGFRVRKCRITGLPHAPWICEHCSAAFTDEFLACELCWAPRAWYCDVCSMKNHFPDVACSACGGEGKLSSLGSFHNRQSMKDAGVDAAEIEREANRNQDIAEGKDRLDQRLQAINAKPIPIDDDGNCLFRALAYQLFRDEALFQIVRELIVDFMDLNRHEYIPYIGAGAEFEQYIQKMRTDKTWGDEFVLQAAARLFCCTLHVITSEPVRYHLRYKPSTTMPSSGHSQSSPYLPASPAGSIAPGRHLFLAYLSPVHYYCFCSGNDDPTVPIIVLERELSGFAPATTLSPSESSPTMAGAGGSSEPSPTLRTALQQPPPRRGSLTDQHAADVSGAPTQPQPAVFTPIDIPSALKPRKIHRIPMPVVVVLRCGSTPYNLAFPPAQVDSAAGSSTTSLLTRPAISKTGTKFYLHPIASGVNGAPSKSNYFGLQCIATGNFLAVQLASRHHRSSDELHSRGSLGLEPLRANEVERFLILADEATDSLHFPLVNLKLRYDDRTAWAERFGAPPAPAPSAPSPILLLLLFSGRPERLCIKCSHWFDESTLLELHPSLQAQGRFSPSPSPTSSSGSAPASPSTVRTTCHHQSALQEGAGLLLQRATATLFPHVLSSTHASTIGVSTNSREEDRELRSRAPQTEPPRQSSVRPMPTGFVPNTSPAIRHTTGDSSPSTEPSNYGQRRFVVTKPVFR